MVANPFPDAVTFEGAAGHTRDLRTELYLLGASNFVGEDDFYETGLRRDQRYAALVRQAAIEDPDWTSRFLLYLRSTLNMRSAPLVGAAEFLKARLDAGAQDAMPFVGARTARPGDVSPVDAIEHKRQERGLNRRTIDGVCQRADEPGELLAYWLVHYGRRLPMALKRGLGDAANRLYTGRSLLVYDAKPNRPVWFGDVIDLCHPSPRVHEALTEAELNVAARQTIRVQRAQYKSDVFQAALDRRHGRTDAHTGSVVELVQRAELMAVPVEQRRALLDDPNISFRMRKAAMTWQALAGWLQGPMDAKAWAAILPSMGYMAKLRNLRNFDAKGLPDELAEEVAQQLCDPTWVAMSRQLPMRFLSAYRAAPSARWAHPLEKALDLSVNAITELAGKSLVLIDTSTSMDAPLAKRSTLKRWDAAALFGLAIASRCEDATVVSFAGGTKVFGRKPGESLLWALNRFENTGYFLRGGTDTYGALSAHYNGHDRVLIITDEQAMQPREQAMVSTAVPAQVPMYTWNLGGYQVGHAPAGGANRYVVGGLTDAAFTMIPVLESRGHAGWPF